MVVESAKKNCSCNKIFRFFKANLILIEAILIQTGPRGNKLRTGLKHSQQVGKPSIFCVTTLLYFQIRLEKRRQRVIAGYSTKTLTPGVHGSPPKLL